MIRPSCIDYTSRILMTVITRIRDLHRCQEGGVQSLALVMTLPMFVGTVLLIVQLAQVLIGTLTVQYAAFAAARSAAVWITSSLQWPERRLGDDPNEIPILFVRGVPYDIDPQSSSRKLQEIRAAAVQACVAISPARAVRGPRANPADVAAAVDAFLALQMLDAGRRIARWREASSNRWSYSAANTRVRLAFLGEPVISPSYNPVGHPLVPHEVFEAAWDESVTVVVQHEVSLVPGPGRWLLQNAQWGRVPNGLANDWTGSGRLDRVPVVASSTMVLPGIHSLRPLDYPWREE
jgi:hypothetical protein